MELQVSNLLKYSALVVIKEKSCCRRYPGLTYRNFKLVAAPFMGAHLVLKSAATQMLLLTAA